MVESFYTDDGLVGADSVHDAIQLQKELQQLLGEAGFVLSKWKSSHPAALKQISHKLLDHQPCQDIKKGVRQSAWSGMECEVGFILLDGYQL